MPIRPVCAKPWEPSGSRPSRRSFPFGGPRPGGPRPVFDLPNSLQRFGTALTVGVSVVAVGTGLSRGLLAPKSANWRLPPVSDTTAKSLYHLTISITAIEAIQHVVEALSDLVTVSVQTAIATRGLGALAVVIVIGAALRKAWLRRHAAGVACGQSVERPLGGPPALDRTHHSAGAARGRAGRLRGLCGVPGGAADRHRRDPRPALPPAGLGRGRIRDGLEADHHPGRWADRAVQLSSR